ncbi:MAG: lamin tail domain-containing protein, partial [Verrucomicrobiales bacterium]|nr:lamin tail domain-containing protein [Verrucomicrobiales bacterium]
MIQPLRWLCVLAAISLLGPLRVSASIPRVASVTPPTGSLSGVFTELTVVFDQSVIGVDAQDLLVNGRPAAAVNGAGSVYTFSFLQPNYGGVEVKFAPDSAITSAGSLLEVFDSTSVQWAYTLRDIAPPTVLAIHPPEGITIAKLGQVEVTFSEPVTGVKASDLLVNGQPAANVSGASAGPYVFQFPNVGPGAINVSWAGSQTINDLAGVPNRFAGGTGWSYSVDPNAPEATVVISEFLAANVTGLKDETGAVQDWIELHNRGGTPVRLLGWSLSDDLRNPGEWVFPDVTVGPGQFLVVFASGLDRRPGGANAALHTNFRLSRAGEYLGLFNPESPRRVVHEFAPNYPEQRNDYSFGQDPSGPARYFRSPSPGAANGPSSIAGVAAPPEFSVERGFFSSFPFYLTLGSATPRATIRFTTDGSEPTETKGTTYSEPIFVNETKIIRAAAFAPNMLPSQVVTHSYFFNQTIATKSLPVLSIVTATNNLFGPTGIMEFNPRNTTKHGIAWERPASAELIRSEDNSGFQINGGLRVLGGDVVREIYNYNAGPPAGKYSFGLFFRGDYGANSLQYPLFENSALEEFERVGLRAGFNDPLNPFIGDELVRRLMLDMGQVGVHGTFVNLFLDGVYKGYYNPTERIDSRFLRAWHGGSNGWDIIHERDTLEEGTIDEWNALRAFIANSDFSLAANYQEVSRRLDLANFVDYLLVNIYAATGDWPGNNWRAARERVSGAKWRFYSWDAEISFGTFNNARTVEWNEITQDLEISTRTSAVGDFFAKLRVSPEFRLLFADRVQKHFFDGGALTDANVLRRFEELRKTLLGVIPVMKDTIPRIWVPQRRGIIFTHMINAGLLPFVSAPVFSQSSGPVPRGFNLTMAASGGQIYYTVNGADPRVALSGAVSAEARLYSGQPVTLNASTTLKARAFSGGNWSALTEGSFTVAVLGIPLRLTEVMYNPAGGDAYEFLEIQNVGSTTLDLGGLNFGGLDFRFPDLATLAAGERFLIASAVDPAAFAARYPDARVNGYFNRALANGGEKLTLRNAEGRTITSVEYNDENGWPLPADGRGPSLELLDPDGDPNDPASWRASALPGGSPGTAPIVVVPNAVQLNEVMTRNINS